MKIEKVNIDKVFINENNPRFIRDTKFEKLVNSIKQFPKMLEIRPIVVNDEMIVLGGNMRLKACEEAGLKEVYVIKASELTAEEQEEFIIKDNVSFGEWDFNLLANNFDDIKLGDWGIDVPNVGPTVDYSILDEDNKSVDSKVDAMSDGVKKAIQIEFEKEHFQEAYELVKHFREQGLYIGGFLMEKLKEEKEKI